MDRKRFASPPPEGGASIPFDLVYYRQVDPPDDNGPVDADAEQPEKVWQQETATFLARHDVSGGALVQIELMSGAARGGPNARGADAVFDFFDAMIIPADLARFKAIINAPDTYLTGETLTAIAIDFYGEYTGRPTKSPRS